jgi:RNA polymerase sigma factor (sigma-70 family)
MRTHKQFPRLSLELKGKDGQPREVYPMIVQYVMRSCKSFKAADPGTSTFEDFLSAAVVRVMRAHNRYDQSSALSSFLIPHIKGAYLDLMRVEMNYMKRTEPWGAPHQQRADPTLGGIPAVEEAHDMQVLKKQLRDALPHLTALQRAVIYHKYFQDSPMGQIAQKLGITKAEAAEAHTRALMILRSRMKK